MKMLQPCNILESRFRLSSLVNSLSCNAYSFMICAYPFSLQGILHLRGRPAVAYDQQGLVFAIAMEGGAVKLFDSRCYDKVSYLL